MELFYSDDIFGTTVKLDQEESAHCVRVLRHRVGDEISVIDGKGTLLRCTLTDANPKAAMASLTERIVDFGTHPYHLTMAVCPTKNIDRYEWFAEKATEMGVDSIVPVIGEHSERKIIKPERLNRILLSATKQSLKAAIPVLEETISVKEYLQNHSETSALKLVCCCFEPEGGRKLISDLLSDTAPDTPVKILIGPEGDFSEDELRLALQQGWIPVSLGDSRLRTETAALAAVAAVYLRNIS